jgi:hypothetical protein
MAPGVLFAGVRLDFHEADRESPELGIVVHEQLAE